MILLTKALLKIKPVRRAVLDVRRCEQSPLLQKIHQYHRVARYESTLARFPAVTDLFVISFPKSGRTWHRFALGNYLADLYGFAKSHVADVERLTETRLGMRTRYDHNGANFADAIGPEHPVVANPAMWCGHKVIFLVRDPRDVLVSAWHHARYRLGSFSGAISEFVRSPYAGIDKLLIAQNRWWAARGEASSHLVLSYERMHIDLAGALRDTLAFGGWQIDEDRISRSVAASSFAAMREAESRRAVDHWSMRAPAAGNKRDDDDRGRKVREGKVGGHREHLSPDDLAYIDSRIASLGNPFASFSVLSPAA